MCEVLTTAAGMYEIWPKTLRVNAEVRIWVKIQGCQFQMIVPEAIEFQFFAPGNKYIN